VPARETHVESQSWLQQNGSVVHTLVQQMGLLHPGLSRTMKQDPCAVEQIDPQFCAALIVSVYLFGEVHEMSAPPIVG
jgi:hypothetical protein